ncbi:hypothetical protein [Stackebrandtia soli]|uniref:hypothetical protein n=1 Tax=Stackebrandtia soli TaxID=1892856 RepID=UPI0039E977B1
MPDATQYFDEDGAWLGQDHRLGSTPIQTANQAVFADGGRGPDCGTGPLLSVPDFWVANTSICDDGVVVKDLLALEFRPPTKPGPRPKPPISRSDSSGTYWLIVGVVVVLVLLLCILLWTQGVVGGYTPILVPSAIAGGSVLKRPSKLVLDTDDAEYQDAVREHTAVRREYAKARRRWENARLCRSCEEAWFDPTSPSSSKA